MFFIYRILTNLIILISPLIILVRIIKKKEDKNRFKEKQIDIEDLISDNSPKRFSNKGTKIINGLFLVLLNMILMGIIGFLTFDSNSNMNSKFGGVLLSIFLPFFIVVFTKKMSGIERMLKFGFGYFAYFILVLSKFGFPKGFVSGLFPCLLMSLSVLYFGALLIRKQE